MQITHWKALSLTLLSTSGSGSGSTLVFSSGSAKLMTSLSSGSSWKRLSSRSSSILAAVERGRFVFCDSGVSTSSCDRRLLEAEPPVGEFAVASVRLLRSRATGMSVAAEDVWLLDECPDDSGKVSSSAGGEEVAQGCWPNGAVEGDENAPALTSAASKFSSSSRAAVGEEKVPVARASMKGSLISAAGLENSHERETGVSPFPCLE